MRYRCHCCGYYTLIEDSDDICPVCWWQDDIVQREDPDYGGGPNHGISLK
ncbi:CPCC family cysteine-rich protein [Enterococcus pallens]